MDSSIRIVENSQQVFETHCVVFRELKEKEGTTPITVFVGRKQKH
jgi:hypothetical protein